ncbi:MAG TPA: chemotaxis protein CheW [Gemmatimonadales bacterium]
MADFAGLRLVVFRVGDVICAADVTSVREILPTQRATRIPGAPSTVTGLINVRGDLITLVHGSQLLGRNVHTSDGVTLLCTVGAQEVGMAVDEVLDLIAVSEDDLAQGSELPGIDRRLVRAVGQLAGRSFIVLDLEALLGPVLSS